MGRAPIALLVPSYNPNNLVTQYLKNYKRDDFEVMVVVNDGSKKESLFVFEEIKELKIFDVVSYDNNQGKGYALKRGLKRIIELCPDVDGVITIDDDGQHSYEDVMRIKEALIESDNNTLVLGVRDFSKTKKMPLSNRMGNKFSAFYYKCYTKKSLHDTQTGLRGIPASLFDNFLDTKGNHYEFEMNFLLETSKEYNVTHVDIEAIYNDNSEQRSSFKPLLDSYRIYKTPIHYVLISLLCFLIDLGLFSLCSQFVFASFSDVYRNLLSVFVPRIISGIVYFILNFYIVFPSKGNRNRKIIRYLILFSCNMVASFGFTYLFDYILLSYVPRWFIIIVKAIIDICLAIMNFFFNWLWVFATKNKKK